MKYRKKPVVIEARRLPLERSAETAAIAAWCGGVDCRDAGSVLIHTLEGDMYARPGDWVIQGIKGEHYPVKDDIFRETYEAAE